LLFVVFAVVAFCLLTLECIASGYWQQSTYCRPNGASKFELQVKQKQLAAGWLSSA